MILCSDTWWTCIFFPFTNSEPYSISPSLIMEYLWSVFSFFQVSLKLWKLLLADYEYILFPVTCSKKFSCYDIFWFLITVSLVVQGRLLFWLIGLTRSMVKTLEDYAFVTNSWDLFKLFDVFMKTFFSFCMILEDCIELTF